LEEHIEAILNSLIRFSTELLILGEAKCLEKLDGGLGKQDMMQMGIGFLLFHGRLSDEKIYDEE
jgi:hypothetical protein